MPHLLHVDGTLLATQVADVWTTLGGFFSSPLFVYPAISGLVAGLTVLAVQQILGWYARRKREKHTEIVSKEAERRAVLRTHSLKLKDGAFMPWSRAGISRQEWYAAPDFGCLRLFIPEPQDLFEQPVFQWGRSHVENAYPEIMKAWSTVQSDVDLNSAKARVLNEILRTTFAALVQLQYGSLVHHGLSVSQDQDGSVYFEDTMMFVVLRELWVIPNRKPEWVATTGAASQPRTGTRIVINSNDVALLRWNPTEGDVAA